MVNTENYTIYRLEDVVESISNGTTIRQNKEKIGYRVSRIETISQGVIDLERTNFVELNQDHYSKFKLNDGDILFSHINSTSHLGKTAIYTSELGELIHGMNLLRLVPNKSIILPKFLLYLLKDKKSRAYFQTRCKRAVNQSSLDQKTIKNFELIVPSIETQKKIVEILAKAEKLKEWRAEADELADEYLESIFYDMFGDPINNQKGYVKIKLGKLSKIRRGGSPRPIKNYLGGTVPWIKIGDGTKGDEIYIEDTKEKITEDGLSKTVLLKKGSLIFANCGVSLGFARILKIEGCIHDGWLALEDIDPKLNNIYLLKLINSISDYFRKSAPDGTQPNLNTKIMKNFEIPVPPITLQNQFAQIVQQIETLKTHQSQSKQEIDNLFNTLMQKAFKGELVC